MKAILLFYFGVTLVTSSLFAQDNLIMERVTIPNGDIQLEGLLVMAAGEEKKSAIIFLGGSGEWEIVNAYLKNPKESYGDMIRFYIEEKLLSQHFAVLYFNKRGCGNSTGSWQKSGFQERASDALAAVEFLSRHPKIDGTKIGLAGHSQGGWVAQLAASQSQTVAFSISFAGPSMSVYDQTLLNDQYFYKCDSLTEGKKKSKKMFRKIELGLGGAVGKVIGGEAGQWARIRKYDHDQALKTLKSPSLFIFGEHDIFVPPQENLDHLHKIFPDGVPSNIQILEIKGIDHAFHEVPGPCVPWTESTKNNYSEILRTQLVSWVLQQTDTM